MLKKIENENLILYLSGKIDSTNTETFEQELEEIFAENVEKNFIFDAENLEYISSAGLRVLLSTHKNFAKKGGMTITNVNETVMDIFDVTGFKDILTIK